MALATGALAACLGYLVAIRFLNPAEVTPELYTTLAFPFLLGVFGLVTMLTVAATSRFTTDDDREWWARSGAWILLTLLVWLAFSFAVLYGPDLFRDAVAKIAAAGGIAGIVASRLGFSSQTGAGPRSDQPAGALSGSMGSRLRSYALKLAAPTFIVLMLLLVAIFD